MIFELRLFCKGSMYGINQRFLSSTVHILSYYRQWTSSGFKLPYLWIYRIIVASINNACCLCKYEIPTSTFEVDIHIHIEFLYFLFFWPRKQFCFMPENRWYSSCVALLCFIKWLMCYIHTISISIWKGSTKDARTKHNGFMYLFLYEPFVVIAKKEGGKEQWVIWPPIYKWRSAITWSTIEHRVH